VHFQILDDTTNPATSIQLMNQILTKAPVVMLGPALTATCLAATPLIKSPNGPVDYCLSPGISPPQAVSSSAEAYRWRPISLHVIVTLCLEAGRD